MRSIVGPDLVVIMRVWFEPSQFQKSRVIVFDSGCCGLADLVKPIGLGAIFDDELPRIGSSSPNSDRVRRWVTEHRSMGEPNGIAIESGCQVNKPNNKTDEGDDVDQKIASLVHGITVFSYSYS